MGTKKGIQRSERSKKIPSKPRPGGDFRLLTGCYGIVWRGPSGNAPITVKVAESTKGDESARRCTHESQVSTFVSLRPLSP